MFCDGGHLEFPIVKTKKHYRRLDKEHFHRVIILIMFVFVMNVEDWVY